MLIGGGDSATCGGFTWIIPNPEPDCVPGEFSFGKVLIREYAGHKCWCVDFFWCFCVFEKSEFSQGNQCSKGFFVSSVLAVYDN